MYRVIIMCLVIKLNNSNTATKIVQKFVNDCITCVVKNCAR